MRTLCCEGATRGTGRGSGSLSFATVIPQHGCPVGLEAAQGTRDARASAAGGGETPEADTEAGTR